MAFGAIHLGNPGEGIVGGLSVVTIALFFCLTLRRTGNLWFAIGLHCSFDWGETFLYSVPNSGTTTAGALSHASLHGARWITGGTIGPEGSVFCFLMIALAFLAFDKLYPAKHA
jgi:membrane protease YdiL (CAAX protease family)